MITSLTIRNFKCFADQMLTLKNLTLLAGLNGTGKSTVPQSLLLLRQSYQQGLLPKIGLALNGDLVNIEPVRDAIFEWASERNLGFALRFSDGAEAQWSFDYDDSADVLALASIPVEVTNFPTALFHDDFNYIQAERIGPRRMFDMSEYNVKQHRQLGSKGEYAAHFLAMWGEDDIFNPKAFHSAAESKRLKDQVSAWMQEIRPGVRIDLTPHANIDAMEMTFSFAQADQVSSKFCATNVGFGITYTLPIVVALVSAKPGALIMLENPEAHLHPKGQGKLGELMALAASGGVQVIVETHSDHILNGIRVATYQGKISPDDIALHFFESEVNDDIIQVNVRHPQIDSDGRIDEWPDGFFDEWDRCLETLLMPREVA